jgi:hypothetical protein
MTLQYAKTIRKKLRELSITYLSRGEPLLT